MKPLTTGFQGSFWKLWVFILDISGVQLELFVISELSEFDLIEMKQMKKKKKKEKKMKKNPLPKYFKLGGSER